MPTLGTKNRKIKNILHLITYSDFETKSVTDSNQKMRARKEEWSFSVVDLQGNSREREKQASS